MVSPAWQYDRECGWHTLAIDESADEFVFVYKSGGGDYVVSAMREGDSGGGELEYLPTLRQAKRFAEKIKADGSYRDYMQGG